MVSGQTRHYVSMAQLVLEKRTEGTKFHAHSDGQQFVSRFENQERHLDAIVVEDEPHRG